MTVALPWLDAVLDGERNWNLDMSDRDWVDYYPIERMRAMSIPQNWGLGICWMGNFDTTNSTKAALAKIIRGEYVWMHDSWLNPYTPGGNMPQRVLDWGLNSSNTVYVPYWRNEFAKCSDPDVLVSLWHIPNEQRAVVGVFNYDRKKTKNPTVRLDLARLGVPLHGLIVRDLYSPAGEPSNFDPARVCVTIKGLLPHRVRLFGIAAIDTAARIAAEKALPVWVTNGVPEPFEDFGLVHKDTKYFPPGAASAVSTTITSIEVGLWQLPDRALVTVYNTSATNTANVSINVDLDALGLAPKPWQEFIGVRDFSRAHDKDNAVSLDYYNRTLMIKQLRPQSGRLVGLRRY